MNETIYQAAQRLGIPVASHESDLYLKNTPESVHLLKEHKKSATIFRSNIDKELWFDIPFAFDPYWESKTKK